MASTKKKIYHTQSDNLNSDKQFKSERTKQNDKHSTTDNKL